MTTTITGTAYICDEGRAQTAATEGGTVVSPWTDIALNGASVSAPYTSKGYADATIISGSGLDRVTVTPSVDSIYYTKWTYTFSATGDDTIYDVLILNANNKRRVWVHLDSPLDIVNQETFQVTIRNQHTAG